MVDPLLAGGQAIWKMLATALSMHDKAKADLFNQHVEPLHQRLVLVHKDYVQAFARLHDELLEPDATIQDAIKFLERRRLDLLHERDLARQIADELASAERRPVRGDAWEALLEYSSAIDTYLTSPYQFQPGSGLTGLVQFARHTASRGSSLKGVLQFARQISSGGTGYHPLWNEENDQRAQLAIFTERVELITFHLLPSAFSNVTATYARLRTLLL